MADRFCATCEARGNWDLALPIPELIAKRSVYRKRRTAFAACPRDNARPDRGPLCRASIERRFREGEARREGAYHTLFRRRGSRCETVLPRGVVGDKKRGLRLGTADAALVYREIEGNLMTSSSELVPFFLSRKEGFLLSARMKRGSVRVFRAHSP